MFENPTTRRVFIQKGLTMLAVGATVPTSCSSISACPTAMDSTRSNV